MKKIVFLFCVLLSDQPFLFAQDTHYWTNQFGTRSAFLSGAVLGESKDNTMVYYNPGALGFVEESSVSINANAYRTENINIENALGQQGDIKSKQLASVPLLAGGMINLKKLSGKLVMDLWRQSSLTLKV